MIYKRIFKFSLFISSHIPLYILIYINEMDEINIQSVMTVYNNNNIFWLTVLTLSIVSIILLMGFFKFNDTEQHTFEDAVAVEDNILDYFITYLIPLVTVDTTKSTSILLNTIIFLIIGVHYVESELLYLNIVLTHAGYKVYKDKSNNILISKKDIDYLKNNKDVTCKQIGNKRVFVIK